ncbi:hypothetical protein RMCBS344292_16862 [Rhizopus microsporus]|nr:hypothetical protein RMCBS344292_16862 [Rhizopus microsporus]
MECSYWILGVVLVLGLRYILLIVLVLCTKLTVIKDTISGHPNCTYYGCDLVDVVDKEAMPKQFTFTIGNVVEGLPYEDNTFDFVHMRLLVLSLREEEWPLAVKEAVRVAKPGGYLQFVESSGDVSTLYILFN